MKEISLKEAYNYLRLCTGVMWEEKLLNVSLLNLEGDDNNEFAYLTLADQTNYKNIDVEIVFKEGDNHKALIKDSILTLIDINGKEISLHLLTEWYVEK